MSEVQSQTFFLDGVKTEVTQYMNSFFVRQHRPLTGMAYGWSPTTYKEWNMGWFRNVSQDKRKKAIFTFKLLELGY